MNRVERLVAELREALGTCNEIEEEEAELAAGLKEKRGELKAARKKVEEIQREILTGASGRPIFDRIAEQEEFADERQRGPTAPAKAPAAIREPTLTGANHADGREPEPAGPRLWKSEDLERELERAVKLPLGVPAGEWATFRRLGGITDAQIVEVLRAIWPQSHAFQEGAKLGKVPGHGYTVHGGVTPRFWIGARRPETLHKPTLEGKALIDRVRSILGLPRAPQSVEAEAAAIKAESTVDTADRPARKVRGPRKEKARQEVTA